MFKSNVLRGSLIDRKETLQPIRHMSRQDSFSESKTFAQVQREIEQIELETNKKIIDALQSCETEVSIRVLDPNFTRNERDNGYPLQLDAIDLTKEYPTGVPFYIKELNRVFGNHSPISDNSTIVSNT